MQQNGPAETIPSSRPTEALVLGERRRILLDPTSDVVTLETVGHHAGILSQLRSRDRDVPRRGSGPSCAVSNRQPDDIRARGSELA